MGESGRTVTEPTLLDAGHAGADFMPMGTECAVHAHREWVPLEWHHIWPKGMGGPDVAENRIRVCANGHYAAHEFIRQLILHAGTVPGETAQHFSAKVKKLAIRGWTEAGKPVHGNGGE
jgi:hypothetical protein